MPKSVSEVREMSKLAYGFMASRAQFDALDLGHIRFVAADTRDVAILSSGTDVPKYRLRTLLAVLISVGAIV